MFSFQQIAAQEGRAVVAEGFVAATRVQSRVAFVILESGPDKIQCVAFGPAREQAKALSRHAWVRVEGVCAASAQAPGGFEIQASSVELVSPADAASWPLGEGSEIGARLAWPAARFRERAEALALSVQSELEFAMVDFLRKEGFVGIHSPKITGTPSESGAEVFKLEHFGEQAYLAQSPQMYKQVAIIGGLRRVYEVGPVFRAEPSFSSRHATEFVSFDVELEGVRSELELIELEGRMILSAMAATIEALGPELAERFPRAALPKAPLILPFAEAQARLGISGEQSLSAEQERELGALMAAEGHELVALTAVPWSQRPFYHMREGELTRSFELIYRGVEITTGAIREHRHRVLMEQLAQKGLAGEGLGFYLDSFKLGAPPHGGFGLGLARLTALFLGLPGIKEVSFVHRGPGRLVP